MPQIIESKYVSQHDTAGCHLDGWQ